MNIRISVPLVPDSVNTYSRHAKGGHYKSARASAFERDFAMFVRGNRIIGEKFAVSLRVYVGPRQHPDVDNLPKQILDGLSRNGVLVSEKGKQLSDNHITKLEVERITTDRENPRTEILIETL